MVNIALAVIATFLFVTPPQPVQPTGYIRPRAYIPMIAGQDTGLRTETIPVAQPGIWLHVKFTSPDASVQAHALVFNPTYPGGTWTRLVPIGEGWVHIRYRVEWNAVPAWATPEAWQPVMAGTPPGDSPLWWHEQRVFELRGTGYLVDALFVDAQ